MPDGIASGAEAKLIKSAAKGDKKAFEQLMESYADVIYSYILVRVNQVHDAADIFQESLLAVWQSLEKFNGGSHFKTWALGITNHKIDDWLRVKYRRGDVRDIDSDEVQNTVFEAESDADEAMDVAAALASLADSERELVHLVFNAGLGYTQIAEMRDIPLGTVKSRMASIRQKLRKALGEDYG